MSAKSVPESPSCSSREAAELLGVVERTVLLYIERAELAAHRKGRRWLIARASVEKHPAYLARHKAAATPAAPAAQPTFDPSAPTPTQMPPKRPRGEWTFRNIRVLTELAALASRTMQALTGLPNVPSRAIDLAIHSAQEAARHGAAGFHAFVKSDKLRLYGRAREFAAMTAASLWILADLAADRGEGLRLMAAEYERTSPSLGSLMRNAGVGHA